MKTTKKLCAALTCAVLLFMGFVLPTQAAVPFENQQRASVLTPSAEVPITMNGKRVLQERAYLLNETTYVALRDFCELLGGIGVSWNPSSQTALMEQGTRQVMATIGTSYILADGRCFYSVQPIRLIDGKTYVPIRALAKSFGVEVEWNASNHSIVLKNTGIIPKSGDEFYNSDDLYWLSRIISAEARGESLAGQIAVGNVVINRKNSSQYPNTIYGVIFDRKHGVQFSPILNGSIYKTPSFSSSLAAKICLEGYTMSDKILFFMNPTIATNHWISQNRPYAFRIGNHVFYY